MRVAVVTPIPTPYRDPFWNAVARREGIDLDVFYCSPGKKDRPWQTDWTQEYHSEVLPGYNLNAWRGKDASCFWNPAIIWRLKRRRYDVLVVGGYNHPTTLASICFAQRHRVPYFLMCESYLGQPRSFWRLWLKEPLVRWVMTRAAGGFPTGLLAFDYLIHYGAPAECLALIPNAPDVVDVARRVDLLRRQRAELRAKHQIGDRPVILFAGRLIRKKGVATLIRAMNDSQAVREAVLLIAGDGPERDALEDLSNQLGSSSRVRFVGFLQPAELAKLYAMADVFVLPSSETWGVVVLEALAAGLPVVVTEEVGCHVDIVTDERVGSVVPARNSRALGAALETRLRQMTPQNVVRDVWRPVFESLRYDNLTDRFLALVKRVVTLQ